MLKKSKIISIFAALVLAMLGSWFVSAETATSPATNSTVTVQKSGSGFLDGMTFDSELGPVGAPADIEDTLVFENGMFVSTECERRCNFPASPYFVRQNGAETEFISETRCPNKDATIVWRGVVKDDQIQGVATWTSSRWYWTVVREIAFSGMISDGGLPISSAN